MEDIVVVPAYQPNDALIRLLEELRSKDFKVIVVDDGSGENYKSIFDKARELSHIITFEKNRGKGAALKAAFSLIKDNYPDCEYVITADADGQHRAEDIVRVKNELHQQASFVLTVRKRVGKIPFRSKIGNNLSKFVYTTLTGHYFSDNQSGLRGFGRIHLDWLTQVGGDRYDYEMNMLYYADIQDIPITTIQIDAIYIDNNNASHFNPLADTLKIYKQLFISARITLFSFLLFESLMLAVALIFQNYYIHYTLPLAGAAATIFHIVMNKFVVFRRFHYGEMIRVIVFSIVKYSIYTLGSILLHFLLPYNSIFLNFNLVFLVFVPVNYYVQKGFHLISKDINKENFK